MESTRFRFSAESSAALGMAGVAAGDMAGHLGFPQGVKVTSVQPDGDGLALSLSGLDGGEVTGTFWIRTNGRVVFEGFRPVASDQAESATTEED